LLHYRNRRYSRYKARPHCVSSLLPLSNLFSKLLNSKADISSNIRPARRSNLLPPSTHCSERRPEKGPKHTTPNKVVAHVLSCYYTGITSICDALLSLVQNDGKRRLVADMRPSSGYRCSDCSHEHYNRISCAKCWRDGDTGDYICVSVPYRMTLNFADINRMSRVSVEKAT
jgi:hypothetical protein